MVNYYHRIWPGFPSAFAPCKPFRQVGGSLLVSGFTSHKSTPEGEMKPDGVATAAMEPMDVMEEGTAIREETQQAAPKEVKKPVGDVKSAVDKTKTGKSGDPKAKAKGPARAKSSTNASPSAKTTGPSPRPGAAQNRVANGIQKQPAANGLAKKTTTPTPEKKKVTLAQAKKPVSPTKVVDKKPAAASRPPPAAGVTTTPSPKKKVPAVPNNEAKAKAKTAAPKPASAAPSKSSTGATAKPDKPSVSMTARPAAGSPAARPAPAASTGKPASSSAKPAPVKTTVPSAARAPTMQSAKPPTPGKKDVSRPASSVAKKPAEAPGRPSAAKTSKNESPKPAPASKSDAPNKRPVSSSKPADIKATRPKAQEVKASASPRPTGSKPKSSASPKKAVGSSTPMPVKRAPKPTQSASAAGEQADENLLQEAAAASDTMPAAPQAQAAEANAAHVPQKEETMELLSHPADHETEASHPTLRPEDNQDLVVLAEPEEGSSIPSTMVESPLSSPPVSSPLQAQSASPVVEPVTSHDDTSMKDQAPVIDAVNSVECEAEGQHQVSASADHLPMISPTGETEVAVEKADEEINVDDDEEEDEEDGADQKGQIKECSVLESDIIVPQTMENFPKSAELDLDNKDMNRHQEELNQPQPGFFEEPAKLDSLEEIINTKGESTFATGHDFRIAQETSLEQEQEQNEEQEVNQEQDEEQEVEHEQNEEQDMNQEQDNEQEVNQEQDGEQEVNREQEDEPEVSREEQDEEQQEEFNLQVPDICRTQPTEEFPFETSCSEFQGQISPDLNDDDDVKGGQLEVQEQYTLDLLESGARTFNLVEASLKWNEGEGFDVLSHHSELMPDILVEKEREDDDHDTQEFERRTQLTEEFSNLESCAGIQGPSTPEKYARDKNDCYQETLKLSTPDLLGVTERTYNQEEVSLMETENKLIHTPSQHFETIPQIPPEVEEAEEAVFGLEMSEMHSRQPMDECPDKSVDLTSCMRSQSPSIVDMGDEYMSSSYVKVLEQNTEREYSLTEEEDAPQHFGTFLEISPKHEEEDEEEDAPQHFGTLQEMSPKHEEEEDAPQHFGTLQEISPKHDEEEEEEDAPQHFRTLQEISPKHEVEEEEEDAPQHFGTLQEMSPKHEEEEEDAPQHFGTLQEISPKHDEEEEEEDAPQHFSTLQEISPKHDEEEEEENAPQHFGTLQEISPKHDEEEEEEDAPQHFGTLQEISPKHDEEEEEEDAPQHFSTLQEISPKHEEEEEEEDAPQHFGTLQEMSPKHEEEEEEDDAPQHFGTLQEMSPKHEEEEEEDDAPQHFGTLQEISSKHEEEEETGDEDEEEADQQDDMDVGSERAEDRCRVPHEDEEEDEDVEMASEGVTESGLESYGNVDEEDFTEVDHRVHNLNLAPPLPPVSSGPWDQLPQIVANQPLGQSLEPWITSPVVPAQPAWLDLGNQSQKQEPLLQASGKSISPVEEASGPEKAGCQPGSLEDAQLAAHCSSGSETGTPEELGDYDSSSGVESRSEDKQRTPVPPAQPDIEQDLGIHLEKGDVEGEEEEEAETLPADEVLGDPPTAHTSAPSSPSSSGDEASDAEGEIQINDASSHGIDNAAFDSKPGTNDLPALDESGEEDGGTPQSAASVPSYAFDCPTSNAHSTAESCGKSPGLFSLENEEQLPEEAKDPCLVQELTLSAATGHIDDHLGSPVALLPISHNVENNEEEEDEGEEGYLEDEQYLLRGKPEIEFPGILSSTGPLEANQHLSPHHHHHHTAGEDPEAQPPYFSAICDQTDNALAGNA